MALSNTAVPKYYAQWRDAVLRREIPVCEEISLEMNRIDARIANPQYYYDADVVEGFIRFCEGEMTLTDGSDLEMLFTFKVWAEQLFGWFYFRERSVWVAGHDGVPGHYETKIVKYRLIHKMYLIVGRGAAKTLFLTMVHAYGLNIDTSTTEQIAVAPTMAQAEETLLPFTTAINRARGALFKFLTEGSMQNTTGNPLNRKKLASTKAGIVNTLTNSILKLCPMAIDRLQGLRCKYATIDEWLSCDIREDVMAPIEQGAAKIKDWMVVAASSEGTVRNGPGDDIKIELRDILKGTYQNPHVSIFWYKLDSIDEVNNPAMWLKANPNLDQTVSYETYQMEKERADKVPSTRNDIYAKRFGIPLEGHTYFFRYCETLVHPYREYCGMPCALGADLSQGDDFCAFIFLFPLSNGQYGIKTRAYITELKMTKLSGSMLIEYQKFLEEGSVMVMPGKTLKMNDVYDDLDRYIQMNEYDVRAFGYDPYNAKDFVERWEMENGSFGIEKVIQGKRTESVPLGELKTLAEERDLLFDELLMQFCMGNCITAEDVNGNRMILKRRQDQKIDCVAAMMDAYVAYKLHMDDFDMVA